MYRSATRRLLPALCRSRNNPHIYTRTASILINPPRFCTSATSETISNQNSGHFQSAASSSSTKDFKGERNTDEQHKRASGSRTVRPGRVEYMEGHARVLRASLQHVLRKCMAQGIWSWRRWKKRSSIETICTCCKC